MSGRVRNVALLAAAVMALSGAVAGASASPRASLPDVESQVMCPVCGVPLIIAQSPQAERERVFIRGLIARGESTGQIKRELVAQFGPAVLALPSHHGFQGAAYLVPIAVLVALTMLLVLTLPRWRRRTRRESITAGTDPPTLGPRDSARLNEELARYDG